MYKFLFIIPLILLMMGCSSNQSSNGESSSNKTSVNEVAVTQYSDSIVISNEFESDQPIQEGLKVGFVEHTSNKYGPCETQMLNQFADYTKAISDGYYSKSLEYFNKDALKHIQKLAEADGEHFELNDIAEMMARDMNEFQESFKQRGVKITMVVPSLVRRVDDGDNIFIVFTNTTNLTGKNGKSLHLSPFEKTLGISPDKGSTWTFLSYDDEVPNILSGVYNEDVINAIMDY